jgi:hypothetical protein
MPIVSFPDDLEVIFEIEEGPEPPTNDWMVVNQE